MISSWVNPGDPSVATVTTPVDLSVTFGGTWSQGESYEIVYNDPWGNTAVLLSGGSGIIARGGHFGGYERILDTFAPDVIFVPDYVQLAYTFARVRADAKHSEIWPLEFNNTIDTLYSVDAGSKPFVNPNSGRDEGQQITDDDYTGTATQLVAGSEVVMQTKHPSRRKVDVSLNLEIDSPSNTSIQATVDLYRSKNDGTPVIVQRQQISADEAEDPVSFFYRDDEVSEFISGTSDKYEYHLEVFTNRADGVVQVQSGGTFNSFIEVTQRNAY